MGLGPTQSSLSPSAKRKRAPPRFEPRLLPISFAWEGLDVSAPCLPWSLVLLWDPHIDGRSFFPVNLSYVSLTLRLAKEPRRARTDFSPQKNLFLNIPNCVHSVFTLF